MPKIRTVYDYKTGGKYRMNALGADEALKREPGRYGLRPRRDTDFPAALPPEQEDIDKQIAVEEHDGPSDEPAAVPSEDDLNAMTARAVVALAKDWGADPGINTKREAIDFLSDLRT